MKIIITESQYKKFKHLFEQSVYDDEEEYSDSEFNNGEYGVGNKEGMVFRTEIATLPLTFTFSEKKLDENGNVEYYGEIVFNGDEFFGAFATDKRGYLLPDNPVDFYSVLSDEDVRLQDELKNMLDKNYYYQFEHWLDSEVIPVLMD